MALFAYLSEPCREQASTHGRKAEVERIAAEIELNQQACFGHLNSRFERKYLGKDFRLIMFREKLVERQEEHEVVVLAAFWRKGNREYDEFVGRRQDMDTCWRVLPKSQPTRPELQAWLRQRLEKEPAPQPPEPSNFEREFLVDCLTAPDDGDYQVLLETEHWMKLTCSEEWKTRLALLRNALQDEVQELPSTASFAECAFHWSNTQGVGFLYSREAPRPEVLLIEPLIRREDEAAARQRHDQRVTQSGLADVRRLANRAYPSYFLLDHDAWAKIQSDPQANLALSPEELDLLEGLRRTATGEAREVGFPLFINGRAGSGKSTMLQYLAADLLAWWLKKEVEGPQPLYTTCGQELLQRARETVRRQLRFGHRHLLEPHATERVDACVESCFVVFHDFARSLLPESERARFAPENRVTFARFKQLFRDDFAKTPGARRHRVELAWHVIRSVIKGTSTEPLADPPPHDDLPRWCKGTVSVDEYNAISQQVYDGWYRRGGREKGWWDEQDLVAELLSGDQWWAGRHLAVLCDEAQDFTAIEFELLLQLSVFSRRQLHPEELRFVPIAFAGDPLQTLNPTGFRWSSVRASFHDRYKSVMPSGRSAHLPDLRLHELHFNYRSNPGIARFCNTVQLLRASRLGEQELRPQASWRVDPPTAVVWLDAENPETAARLATLPEAVKIIDCHDGEETRFVQQDAFLQRILPGEEEGVFRNVLSPARAKGLEFETVILYRFGRAAPADASSNQPLDDAPAKRLEIEYFLNRLYVAASRARTQLVVVDDKSAVEGFWRFARDENAARALAEENGSFEVWQNELGFLVHQEPRAWDGGVVDPIKQAEEFRRVGMESRDSYLLTQAALAYRGAGKKADASRCLACAAEFGRRFEDAARLYEEIGADDDALRCHWTTGRFDDVQRVARDSALLVGDLRARAAAAWLDRALTKSFFETLSPKLRDPAWTRQCRADKTWRQVLSQLLERLAKDAPEESSCADVLDALEHDAELRAAVPDFVLGSLAFAAKRHALAIRHWEKVQHINSLEYFECKAAVDPFPRALCSLAKLRRLDRHQQIVERWQREGILADLSVTRDRDVALTVADAALETLQPAIAVDLAEWLADGPRLEKALRLALRLREGEQVLRACEALTRQHVRAAKWEAAIHAAETGDPTEDHTLDRALLHDLLAPHKGLERLFETVVREMAVSDPLAKDTPVRQSLVTDFLSRHYLGDAHRHFTNTCSAVVVGAALERAGKLIPCIQFYGNVANARHPAPILRRHAAERLVRSFEKLGKYYEDKSDWAEAQERYARAHKLRQEFGLGDRAFDDLPRVEIPSEAASVTPNRDLEVIDGFEFRALHKARRLQIMHLETEAAAAVHLATGTVTSDSLEIDGPPSGGDGVWSIPAWNMTVRFKAPIGEQRAVQAEFAGRLIERIL